MILYLGLDPSRWKTNKSILHYPVIQIVPHKERCLTDVSSVTHLLFTSRSAAMLWDTFTNQQIVAVGEATAFVLREKGVCPVVAPHATQEGVIELLSTWGLRGAYIVWPRSSKARDILADYLSSLEPLTRSLIIDLYETHYQKLEPVPSLDRVEEIVFTSPSTVEGFLRIYGSLPKEKKLTAIGPVTGQAIAANR